MIFYAKDPEQREMLIMQEREGITETPKFQWRQDCTESRRDWSLIEAPSPIKKMDTFSIIKGGKTRVTVVDRRVN